jgi:hypothetical protein
MPVPKDELYPFEHPTPDADELTISRGPRNLTDASLTLRRIFRYLFALEKGRFTPSRPRFDRRQEPHMIVAHSTSSGVATAKNLGAEESGVQARTTARIQGCRPWANWSSSASLTSDTAQ